MIHLPMAVRLGPPSTTHFAPTAGQDFGDTWGYRRLMLFKVPSGSLASSVSRTAWTVVARGCRVRASTWRR